MIICKNLTSLCVIISPGKCAGSAIASVNARVIYSHGPFFKGFTKSGRRVQSLTRKVKVFFADIAVFFKLFLAQRIVIILRDKTSWNEAMFWQDFPKIYLDALNAHVIDHKQDSQLIDEMYQYWLNRAVWDRWIEYFCKLFFLYGFVAKDLRDLATSNYIVRGKVVLVDYDFCFSEPGKNFFYESTGVDLTNAPRLNVATEKWYADLRAKFSASKEAKD